MEDFQSTMKKRNAGPPPTPKALATQNQLSPVSMYTFQKTSPEHGVLVDADCLQAEVIRRTILPHEALLRNLVNAVGRGLSAGSATIEEVLQQGKRDPIAAIRVFLSNLQVWGTSLPTPAFGGFSSSNARGSNVGELSGGKKGSKAYNVLKAARELVRNGTQPDDSINLAPRHLSAYARRQARVTTLEVRNQFSKLLAEWRSCAEKLTSNTTFQDVAPSSMTGFDPSSASALVSLTFGALCEVQAFVEEIWALLESRDTKCADSECEILYEAPVATDSAQGEARRAPRPVFDSGPNAQTIGKTSDGLESPSNSTSNINSSNSKKGLHGDGAILRKPNADLPCHLITVGVGHNGALDEKSLSILEFIVRKCWESADSHSPHHFSAPDVGARSSSGLEKDGFMAAPVEIEMSAASLLG